MHQQDLLCAGVKSLVSGPWAKTPIHAHFSQELQHEQINRFLQDV
jgi:hypothetical protein